MGSRSNSNRAIDMMDGSGSSQASRTIMDGSANGSTGSTMVSFGGEVRAIVTAAPRMRPRPRPAPAVVNQFCPLTNHRLIQTFKPNLQSDSGYSHGLHEPVEEGGADSPFGLDGDFFEGVF